MPGGHNCVKGIARWRHNKSMKRVALPLLLASSLPAADSRIVTGMNAFTAASYEHLAKGEANLILSPMNIATALSMVWSGARGRTADQIGTVLHQQHDATYDSELAALLSSLAGAGNSGANQLLTANGVWTQKDLPIEAAFQKVLADDYHAPLVPLDFKGNAESGRAEINQWVEDHTKSRISNLFPPGSIDSRTRMVLASAIYFLGKWQNPFKTAADQGTFRLVSGGTRRADFMQQTARFNYSQTLDRQVLELPYAGTGIAFDIILPRTADGLASIEHSIRSGDVTTWLGSLAVRNVHVTMPKFRVESQFSLKEALSRMGMPLAFSDHADFSGIDGKGQLAISEAMHKAYVDVTEEGTEAAAATGLTMRATAMIKPEPPIEFLADHPFLFLIRDTRSGVILFIGRLMDPVR